MQILLFLFSVDIDMKKDIESLIAEERADIILKYATVSLHRHLCVLTWFILGLTKNTKGQKFKRLLVFALCAAHFCMCGGQQACMCVGGCEYAGKVH